MREYCKVLIIDDEFIMRQGMKHMLNWEEEGFQVVGEATNGREGLDLIELKEPDIVIADIVMPVLDGIEFSKILKERYPDIQLIILSSYDKFEYVKETLLNGAVDYILKPAMNPENLLKTLKKAAFHIPGMQLEKDAEMSVANQLERMLTGYGEYPKESQMSKLFCHTRYLLASVNLKTMCGSRKANMAKAEQEIKEALQSCEAFVNVPLFLNEELLCMVLNFRVKDEAYVHQMLTDCAGRMAGRYESVFFVAGRSFSRIEELKECYHNEILSYVDRQFYYPGKNIVFSDGAKVCRDIERFAFEAYNSCLMYKQFEEALCMLGAYVDDILEAQMDEYKVKNLTKNLLYNYLVEIEKYNVQSDELRQRYFKAIDKSRDVERFRKVYRELTERLRMIVKDQIEIEDRKVLEIKNYIAAHYNEDLDLKELSSIFGFNYNYLSSYFNQHTKEGFSEYLNKVRIDKACEFLRDGRYTISEISQMTGYSDHSYFSRVFKKTTGDTPSEYRRRKIKENRL